MNATSTKLPAPVIGNASLIRPQFSPGLLLQDDDLTQVVDYMRDMTRLLFRTMLGCGVLCGFGVTARIECGKLKIDVAKGVALDCRGDLIELPGTQTVEIDPSCGTPIPPSVWVVICHREQPCAPRDVMCSPQDGDVSPVKTRIRDGYAIQVLDAQPAGYCTCEQKHPGEEECCYFIASPNDPCYKDHYDGVCACACNCDCIVLAKVTVTYPTEGNNIPTVDPPDHSVRRFIRPVLMSDPLTRYQSALMADPLTRVANKTTDQASPQEEAQLKQPTPKRKPA